MPNKKDIYYEDLSLDPIVNSEGDVSTVTNKDSVKQSIYMIVNTARGSRPFMPDYGSRIKGFLFEPFDESTAKRIGLELQETIQNHEPRIEILSINVNMNWKNTQYDAVVVYRLVNTQQLDALNVTLNKL
jgi:phage baseplate assembly protein W